MPVTVTLLPLTVWRWWRSPDDTAAAAGALPSPSTLSQPEAQAACHCLPVWPWAVTVTVLGLEVSSLAGHHPSHEAACQCASQWQSRSRWSYHCHRHCTASLSGNLNTTGSLTGSPRLSRRCCRGGPSGSGCQSRVPPGPGVRAGASAGGPLLLLVTRRRLQFIYYFSTMKAEMLLVHASGHSSSCLRVLESSS